MSIKGNNTSGLISATAADFTILENTTTSRWAVTIINLHEHSGVGDTVDLFISADAVSASTERIDQLVLGANETKSSLFTTAVLEAGEFLLGNAVTGALVNVEAIYTAYSGDS